jgi:hypothetical protein
MLLPVYVFANMAFDLICSVLLTLSGFDHSLHQQLPAMVALPNDVFLGIVCLFGQPDGYRKPTRKGKSQR